MEMAKIEAIWQEVLRRRYPGVIVREDRSIPEDDDWPFLGVYMLPDDKVLDFQNFFIEELWKIKEKENLPDANLLDHTVSNTKLHYPRYWQEAQKELRSTKSVSAVARASKPHKSDGRAKKSALTHDSIAARAKRGDMKKFDRVMGKIRTVKPAANDRI
ncbi:MAG TPA: hypothetical protein VKX17_25435 [Planctomycetota bacterium]|nr:hypothetical protein [Planctomycetota bacterium]